MNEIGSEFWSVPIVSCRNDLFPESTQWYLSGRSALQAIICNLKDCKTVAMPSWCCDSMVKPFVDAGLAVHFYPVYWREGLVQEISFNSDVLLLMDYFGYTSVISKLAEYHGIVIRDVTHSLFSTTYTDGDYYFGSLRKWCGVWTGGYAWAADGHKLLMEQRDDHGYLKLRELAMQQKAEYIEESINDKGYLRMFEEAEAALENVGIVHASSRDIDLAQKLDVEFIKKQRRKNAEVIRKSIPDWLMFPDMKSTDTPMFVPILVPEGKRDALRRYLITNDVYCPVHWPLSKFHKLDERTNTIYRNELSLVCDQRYTEEDMYRMVELIRRFMEVK